MKHTPRALWDVAIQAAAVFMVLFDPTGFPMPGQEYTAGYAFDILRGNFEEVYNENNDFPILWSGGKTPTRGKRGLMYAFAYLHDGKGLSTNVLWEEVPVPVLRWTTKTHRGLEDCDHRMLKWNRKNRRVIHPFGRRIPLGDVTPSIRTAIRSAILMLETQLGLGLQMELNRVEAISRRGKAAFKQRLIEPYSIAEDSPPELPSSPTGGEQECAGELTSDENTRVHDLADAVQGLSISEATAFQQRPTEPYSNSPHGLPLSATGIEQESAMELTSEEIDTFEFNSLYVMGATAMEGLQEHKKNPSIQKRLLRFIHTAVSDHLLSDMALEQGEEKIKEMIKDLFEKELKLLEEHGLKNLMKRSDFIPTGMNEGGHGNEEITSKRVTDDLLQKLSGESAISRAIQYCPTLFATFKNSMTSDEFVKDMKTAENKSSKMEVLWKENTESAGTMSASTCEKVEKVLNAKYVMPEVAEGEEESEMKRMENRTKRYNGIMTAMKTHRAHTAHLQARLRQKEVTAAKLCEEMVAISKQVLTPATIESGLLMRLSGTTIRGHQFFSRSGMVASRTVVNQVLISLSDQYLKLVEKEIESSVNDHSKKVLVILDNYNILRWLKRVKAAVTKVKPVLLSFFPDTAS